MKSTSHNLRRGLALGALVFALTAPAASAAPVDPVDQHLDGQALEEAYSVAPVEFPDSPSLAPSASDGFDWGDAGIGAAGMLALAAIASGGAVIVMHRPSRSGTAA